MSTYLIVLDGADPLPQVTERLEEVLSLDPHARFGLLVPASRRKDATEGECWLEAAQMASSALEVLRLEGLPVLDAVVGDFLRRKAIDQEMAREDRVYDEVILFTARFRPGVDVQRKPADIASQLRRRHGVPISHIVIEGSNHQTRPPSSERLKARRYASLSHRN